MNTEEFLRAVLPSKGNYFLALPFNTSKGYKHLPFTSIEEMAENAIKVSDKGVNTYFACASFAQPKYTVVVDGEEKTKYRTGDNAQYARSQWLDLDGDQKENLTQLTRFCVETGLPHPNIRVNSGNGLHVYWTFERDVPKDQWLMAARTFKAICAHYRLGHKDTSRTADIASVLRPIGTNNDKTSKGLGVKPVRLLGTAKVDPILFADWVRHLLRIRDSLGITIQPPRQVTNDLNSDLSGGTEYPPSSAKEVAKHCKQLGDFQNFRGVGQSEPTWRDCIGVLKSTVDGLEVLHEWSGGHGSYDEDETQSKFDNWKTGPTTCAKFKDDNPDGCQGCKHWGKIKSPIQLGLVIPEQITEITYETPEGETVTEKFEALPPRFDGKFQASDKGLVAYAKNSEGSTESHMLSEAIPRVIEYYKDADDKTWKAVVRAYIKPGVYNEAVIDAKVLGQGGTALTGALAGSLCITTLPGKVRLMESYMHTWMEEIRKENEETAMHTHMGWYEDGSFLLGERKYLPSGEVKKVRLRHTLQKIAETMVPHGDVERYKYLIDKAYNRPNHEAHQFTWLAGFGSVLVSLVHPEPIGVVFDGWSRDSGLGKSTVAKLATGIWGKPDMVAANRTTEYALTLNAGMRRNLPLVLDESTDWDGKRIGSFAYDYGSGRAKEQGKADGGLRDNSGVNWCNILFVTGNVGMTSKIIAEHANGAPQIARILEYEFKTPHTQMLNEFEGPEVFAELFTIYGTLGDKFIRYVVPRVESIKQEIIETRRELQRLAEARQDARFWALGAAVTLVAERITKELGFHSFDSEKIKSWTVDLVASMKWTSKSAVKDVSLMFGDMMAALQHGFIVTNNLGNKRGEVASYAPGYGPPRGTVTGRVIANDQIVYLSYSAMSDWCKKQDIAVKDMMDILKYHKWYKGSTKFRLGTGTLVAIPPTNVVQLDWKAFGSVVNLIKPEYETVEEVV